MTYDWQESPATPDKPCLVWASYTGNDVFGRWWSGTEWRVALYGSPIDAPKLWAVIPQPAPPRKVVEDPHADERARLMEAREAALDAQRAAQVSHVAAVRTERAAIEQLNALPVPAHRWVSGEDET